MNKFMFDLITKKKKNRKNIANDSPWDFSVMSCDNIIIQIVKVKLFK